MYLKNIFLDFRENKTSFENKKCDKIRGRPDFFLILKFEYEKAPNHSPCLVYSSSINLIDTSLTRIKDCKKRRTEHHGIESSLMVCS